MKKCFLVAGLLFGDEGKGATVDFLTRRHGASLIVRYNGGPQNAHNVVTPEGRHHTFSQFGSGSFVPGVRTHLSEHMLINPSALLGEGEILNRKIDDGTDIFDRLTVDPNAVVITPYQRSMNRLRELARGKSAHGSCGVGLGQAREDSLAHPERVLRMGHLLDKDETMKRLKFIQELHASAAVATARSIPDRNWSLEVKQPLEWFDGDRSQEYLWDLYTKFPTDAIIPKRFCLRNLLETSEVVIFEGSQGVLLDEEFGFHPHVTWTDTTFRNAYLILQLAQQVYGSELIRIGCLRPYATRHGAGPLPLEDNELALRVPEDHNKTGRFQGAFRAGYLDLSLVRKSLQILGGIDEISLSCFDRIAGLPHLSFFDGPDRQYTNGMHDEVNLLRWAISLIEEKLNTPVVTVGMGPRAIDRFQYLPGLKERAA